MQKNSLHDIEGSWYFVGQIFPLFFWLEKKHHLSPFRAAKTRQLEATLCTQAELWDKMDRETKPPKGWWNGAGWRLPPLRERIPIPPQTGSSENHRLKMPIFGGHMLVTSSLEGNINPLKFGIKKHRTIAFDKSKPHCVIELWKTKESRKVSNEQEGWISEDNWYISKSLAQWGFATFLPNGRLDVSRFWLNAFYHGGATTIQRMKLPYVLSRVGQEFAAWIWVGKAFV